MINLIIGKKGSGKTGRLVKDLNDHAVDHGQNVICIESGRRLDRNVKYQIRLIDITEYPVAGFDNLLSFIAGICAKDYDITHMYIDSIYKVAQSDDLEAFTAFLKALSAFLKEHTFTVNILLSADRNELSDELLSYVKLEEF